MIRPRQLLAVAIGLGVVLAPKTPAAGSSSQEPTVLQTDAIEAPAQLRAAANGYYVDGDLESAAQIYRRLAALAPDAVERATALLHTSWLEFLLGRSEKASSTLEQALHVDPYMTFEADHFSPEFERIYLQARVRVARESAGAPAPRIEYRVPGSGPSRAQAFYRQGLELLETGRGDEALAALERASALTYSDERADLDLRRRALVRIGLLFFERNQWEDAGNAFAEAVDLDRSDPEAWKNLGLARFESGAMSEAIQAFTEAYTLDPAGNGHARNLARALVRGERWDEAVSWILDAVRHHPGDAYLRLQLGEAQIRRGATDRAEAAWRQAIDLDDTLERSHGRQASRRLALRHFEAGDYVATAEIAQAALEHDPHDAHFWNLLGLAQQETGDPANARQSFLTACSADDSRAEYRNNLGRAYAAVGDLARAEEAFVQALTLRPDLPTAQANLAQVRKLRRQ